MKQNKRTQNFNVLSRFLTEELNTQKENEFMDKFFWLVSQTRLSTFALTFAFVRSAVIYFAFICQKR